MYKEQEFESYLKERFTLDEDVLIHLKNVSYFNDWVFASNLPDLLQVNTNDVFDYAKHLQRNVIKIGTINNRLYSLRKYYDCLIKLREINRNPASGVYIKDHKNKVVINPLSSNSLHDLYQSFESFLDARPKPLRIKADADNFSKLKYKLIISLMVYQGLDAGELNRLNVHDIDVGKGTIYIASKARRNSRGLKLEACQLFLCYQYLQSLPATQEKLFKENVEQCLRYSIPCLKGLNPQVKNAEHIRQSRIMVWVSTLKLLDARYLIGHKFVSSTEGYQAQDTTELVDEINTLHLFK